MRNNSSEVQILESVIIQSQDVINTCISQTDEVSLCLGQKWKNSSKFFLFNILVRFLIRFYEIFTVILAFDN